MLTEQAKNSLVQSIHEVSQLQGCMIGLYDENQSLVLHSGDRNASAFGKCVVIVEIIENPNLILPFENQSIEIPPSHASEGKLKAELAQAGMSCGFLLLSGLGIAGAAATAPVTGGASILLGVAAWGGFATQSFQCGTGLYRSWMTATGKLQELESIEKDPVYSSILEWVDRADIGFGLLSIGANARNVIRVRQMLKSQLPVNFKTLSKTAQKKVTAESLRRIYDGPGGEKLIREALREAGFNEQAISRHINNLGRSNGFFNYLGGGGKKVIKRNASAVSKLFDKEAKILTESIKAKWLILREDIYVFTLERLQDETKTMVNVNIISTQD